MTNDTTQDPGIHLPWAGKIVRMEEIEVVLASLWKMSADNLRTGANIASQQNTPRVIEHPFSPCYYFDS